MKKILTFLILLSATASFGQMIPTGPGSINQTSTGGLNSSGLWGSGSALTGTAAMLTSGTSLNGPGGAFGSAAYLSGTTFVSATGGTASGLTIMSGTFSGNGAGLTNLPIAPPYYQTFGDANVTVTSTTARLVHTGTITAPRTVTLPLANSVASGFAFSVLDISGSLTATNNLTLTASGANVLQGGATMGVPYDFATLTSDGTNTWTRDVRGLGGGGTGATTSAAARVNLGAAASGTNGDITALTALAGASTITISASANTVASALMVTNTTAAASGSQQYSGSISWTGQGWKTTATAASQPVSFRSYAVPVQGSTNPTANLIIESSLNGGAYTNPFTFMSNGSLLLPSGGFLYLGDTSNHFVSTGGSGEIDVSGVGGECRVGGTVTGIWCFSGNNDIGSSSKPWRSGYFNSDIQASNFTSTVAGKGLQLKSGTGQRAGNATLAAGTVTVANTTVTANTLVFLTRKTAGGTPGNLTYTLSAGASFAINSDSASDTSVVTYQLIELN